MNKKVETKRGATPLVEKQSSQWAMPTWLMLTFFLVSLIALGAWGVQQISWQWPVQQVDIEGEFRFWPAENIAQELLWVKERNFFTLDVREVRQHIEALPLIRSASVSKRWPSELRVQFKEEIPVARWNDDALLNPNGKVLDLPETFSRNGLPRLQGPIGNSEMVMRQFQRLQSLLHTLDVAIQALSMSDAGSWDMQLTNGWLVKLGRHQQEERAERLLQLIQTLPQEKVVVVDLRYMKGAAIEWQPV